MKVLFINPKISGGYPWIPIGMAYLAAYLRKNKIEVKILDNNFLNLNKEKLSDLIDSYNPSLIGTGGMTVQSKDALKLGSIVKSIDKNLPLVYGGVHFTFLPEDGLKYGDICVIGEGEETILEICKESNFKKIKGIAYKEDNKIILTEERPFIQDLDIIPFPAYDLLEMDRYGDLLITGERAISILTGRGCPYNCLFCASPKLWNRKVRFHSLGYVMSHIKFLIQNYNLKNLRIMDDTFTIQKKRVFEFCDQIEENNFKLNMTCLTNVRNTDYEMFKRMKSVGFSIVAFGVESGNNKILKLINKGITKNDVRKAVSMAKRAGLSTELLFMIGNIGENKKTILNSIEFAKELNPPRSNFQRLLHPITYNYFQFATPFVGSKFYTIAQEYGTVLTKNWDRYHHAEPTFIPKDLDKETMIKLRDVANKETNNLYPSWILSIINKLKNVPFLRKVYSNILKKTS